MESPDIESVIRNSYLTDPDSIRQPDVCGFTLMIFAIMCGNADGHTINKDLDSTMNSFSAALVITALSFKRDGRLGSIPKRQIPKKTLDVFAHLLWIVTSFNLFKQSRHTLGIVPFEQRNPANEPNRRNCGCSQTEFAGDSQKMHALGFTAN
jgi:hypothetical protein